MHISNNGGCKENYGQKVKVTNNKNKLKIFDDQIIIEKKILFYINLYVEVDL